MKQEEDKRTKNRKVGDLGENMACKFLMKHGFEIVEQNYSKKWGEIDIIARKDKKLHFIEVKSVTRENLKAVSPETDKYRPKTDLSNKSVRPTNYQNDWFRPEDNLHPWKLKRLSRVIQTYLLGYRGNRDVSSLSENSTGETDWQFDVAVVYLDINNKEAKINYLEDIII